MTIPTWICMRLLYNKRNIMEILTVCIVIHVCYSADGDFIEVKIDPSLVREDDLFPASMFKAQEEGESEGEDVIEEEEGMESEVGEGVEKRKIW